MRPSRTRPYIVLSKGRQQNGRHLEQSINMPAPDTEKEACHQYYSLIPAEHLRNALSLITHCNGTQVALFDSHLVLQ
jgi:hypothetical protein